jgi:hypothetical protein
MTYPRLVWKREAASRTESPKALRARATPATFFYFKERGWMPFHFVRIHLYVLVEVTYGAAGIFVGSMVRI